jgi:hypothetical protein
VFTLSAICASYFGRPAVIARTAEFFPVASLKKFLAGAGGILAICDVLVVDGTSRISYEHKNKRRIKT